MQQNQLQSRPMTDILLGAILMVSLYCAVVIRWVYIIVEHIGHQNQQIDGLIERLQRTVNEQR